MTTDTVPPPASRAPTHPGDADGDARDGRDVPPASAPVPASEDDPEGEAYRLFEQRHCTCKPDDPASDDTCPVHGRDPDGWPRDETSTP